MSFFASLRARLCRVSRYAAHQLCLYPPSGDATPATPKHCSPYRGSPAAGLLVTVVSLAHCRSSGLKHPRYRSTGTSSGFLVHAQPRDGTPTMARLRTVSHALHRRATLQSMGRVASLFTEVTSFTHELGSSPSSPCLPSPMPLPRAPLSSRNWQSGASQFGHPMPEGMTLGVSRSSVALRRPGSSHPTLWVSPAARAASRYAPGPLTEVSVSRVHRLTVGRDGRSPPSRDSKPSVGLSVCKGLCLHNRPKQPPLTLSRQP